MKKFLIIVSAVLILLFFASCDMNAPDNCDGTWEGSGTNDDGSSYSVYIQVYDGIIRAFSGSSTDMDYADNFSLSKYGLNGSPICEIYYDEEIVNYTNSRNLYDESLYEKDSEGYLLGIDGYYFEYNDGAIVFSGYFHPEINKVEGHFGFYGTYQYNSFTGEM